MALRKQNTNKLVRQAFKATAFQIKQNFNEASAKKNGTEA